MASAALLSVTALSVDLPRDGGMVRVVDGVALSLAPGESLGLVGESGSGKTMTAMSILRMVTVAGVEVSGSVRLEGRDLLAFTDDEIRQVRGNEIALIYQDALSALNPVRTVGHQIVEAIRAHRSVSKREARQRAIALLDRVRIPEPGRRIDSYPHEFSGGMRQRVMIAMALACEPRMLIADEPTTALDVTVQAQVLETLQDLRRSTDMALIFISHDLRAVAKVCDRIAVMYAGRVVETGRTEDVLRNPAHPYTKALLESLPRTDQRTGRLTAIEGTPPDPSHLPTGCRFSPRCPRAEELCLTIEPNLDTVGPDRASRCHFAKEVLRASLAS